MAGWFIRGHFLSDATEEGADWCINITTHVKQHVRPNPKKTGDERGGDGARDPGGGPDGAAVARAGQGRGCWMDWWWMKNVGCVGAGRSACRGRHRPPSLPPITTSLLLTRTHNQQPKHTADLLRREPSAGVGDRGAAAAAPALPGAGRAAQGHELRRLEPLPVAPGMDGESVCGWVWEEGASRRV